MVKETRNPNRRRKSKALHSTFSASLSSVRPDVSICPASRAWCGAAHKVQDNRTVVDRYPNQVYKV